jgi:hypothetical protein
MSQHTNDIVRMRSTRATKWRRWEVWNSSELGLERIFVASGGGGGGGGGLVVEMMGRLMLVCNCVNVNVG